MIGQTVYHQASGQTGEIDAEVEHPDGLILVRVSDRWFFARDVLTESW